METFRNERYGFEIDLPDDWSYSSPGLLKRLLGFGKKQFTFRGPWGYYLHLLVSSLASFEPEYNFSENVSMFKAYASRCGYTEVECGTIKVKNRDHFWSRYRIGGRLLTKKYTIILQRREYVITCRLGLGDVEDKEIKEKERRYDRIVSTFRLVPATDR